MRFFGFVDIERLLRDAEQEYVLVSVDAPNTHLFRREKKDLWTFRAYGLDASIDLASIDVHIPVSAVYKGIKFPTDGSPSSLL